MPKLNFIDKVKVHREKNEVKSNSMRDYLGYLDAGKDANNNGSRRGSSKKGSPARK